ncbi:MAG: glycosyltransferase [Schleiferiaceae bacterium]|nr:glycosyltransferase [Schleiferiaceae bacterium]
MPVKQNDETYLRCLSALRTIPNLEYEVVVVFDRWFDARHSFPQERYRFFEYSNGSGPAAARNFGVDQSRFAHLCFLDSDVLATPETIQAAYRYLKGQNWSGLVGAYDAEPAEKSPISMFRNLLHHYHHTQNAGVTGVFWGAFSIVEKRAIVEVEGFDETYQTASIEDVSLGAKLSKKGFKVVLCPQFQVKHLKKWTLKTMVYTDIFLRAKPWIIFSFGKKAIKNELNTSTRELACALLGQFALLALFYSWYLTFFFFLMQIILQIRWYKLLIQKISGVHIILYFVYHQVYYISAATGAFLGLIKVGKRTIL